MHPELLDDDDFSNAPDDPSLAFAFLEARARERMRQQIAEIERDEYGQLSRSYELEYVTAIISIAEHYQIKGVSDIVLPTPDDFNDSEFKRISQAIMARVYQIKAANAERRRETSVVLSTGEKKRVEEKIKQLRELINESSLEVRRKARLLQLIADFEAELAKPRTNFARFLHVAVLLSALHGVAGFTDDTSKLIENGPKLYEDTIHILAKAKAKEEERHEPLQLPAPPKQLPAPTPRENFDLDDEIPF